MACSLKLFCSGSIQAFFFKKISVKLEYLVGTLMGALFCFKVAIWAFCKKYIVIPNSRAFKVVICTTKVLEFLFNAALANTFLLISFIFLMMARASSIV